MCINNFYSDLVGLNQFEIGGHIGNITVLEENQQAQQFKGTLGEELMNSTARHEESKANEERRVTSKFPQQQQQQSTPVSKE